MRRYYFLIRLFVLSHMICTIGCNGNNETIKILYEDQNEEASKTATAFIDFAEAYEDALDTLNSLEPDDPNTLEVLDDISATLGSLADDMVASTSNLISLEEQIQIALENGNARIQPTISIPQVLVLLTVAGALAYEATLVLEPLGECKSLPQNPGESVSDHAARILACIKSKWYSLVTAPPKAVGVTAVVAGGVALTPHGNIKVVAEVCEAAHNLENIHELYAHKQDSCSPQDNHRIQNRVPINSVADALEDDTSPGVLYIAQHDGSEDGVFPSIPEGDWSLLAFTPDHKRMFIPCVNVSADQTTEVTIDITPIEGCGTTTTIDEEQLKSIVGTWDVTKYDHLCQGFWSQTGELHIFSNGTYTIDLEDLEESERGIADFAGTWELKQEPHITDNPRAYFYSNDVLQFIGTVNETYNEISCDPCIMPASIIVCMRANKILDTP
jgi:hypothetical protein